ncbi:hypothetical protein GUJ93_ZPchr0001g29676 [Zizania palustris]|uniref:Uncharacterized protein n=1 Tax=Zizania palustris TaxID=103762 RepID=A0A8J5R653_ZIZPA|nr:hypothetical protein GUJ93_ZPchr0001g29676 [Zizania palustris]
MGGGQGQWTLRLKERGGKHGVALLAATRNCTGVFHLTSPYTVDCVLDPQANGKVFLKKIREIEVGQAYLKQEISKLVPPTSGGCGSSAEQRRSQSVSPHRGKPPHLSSLSSPSLVRQFFGGLEGGDIFS